LLSCVSFVFILAALEACKQSGSLVVFILVFVLLLSGNDFLNKLLLNSLRLLALLDIACSGLSSGLCVFRNLALLSGSISFGAILLSLEEIRCAFATDLRW
jgi:hypothetical protein